MPPVRACTQERDDTDEPATAHRRPTPDPPPSPESLAAPHRGPGGPDRPVDGPRHAGGARADADAGDCPDGHGRDESAGRPGVVVVGGRHARPRRVALIPARREVDPDADAGPGHGGAAPALAPESVTAALTGPAGSTTATTTTTTTTTTTPGTTLLTIDLKPLDVNLLGLEVKTSEITVTVSAQPGSGALLGNLLADVAGLLNLQGTSNALNTVLANVVTLANEATLSVSGVAATGPLNSVPTPATTPILDVHVAPVDLNLLGAVVTTSPIQVSLIAHSGQGQVLGNVVTDLANLLNTPPKNGKLSLGDITNQLQTLLNELNAQVPGIPAVPTTPVTIPSGSTQVLSLVVPPIDLNLLGLVLTTDQITVNADAQSGNGNLLGNLLSDLLNTLNATPQDLTNLNNELNSLLAKVVGILNATTLTLPTGAVGALSPVLQQLALPNLINATGTSATAPVLDLDIASTTANTPPVDVNLLGLIVTTSDIHAQLVAQTGDGQILGNLVYNVSHLLDPGGSLSVLAILNQLGI